MNDALYERVRRWAEMADELSTELQPLEAVPGETWVLANGLADELAEYAKDLQSELVR